MLNIVKMNQAFTESRSNEDVSEDTPMTLDPPLGENEKVSIFNNFNSVALPGFLFCYCPQPIGYSVNKHYKYTG